MTASVVTTSTDEARVVEWITWCETPGCNSCIRNDPKGGLFRVHCAEHAQGWEQLGLVDKPVFRLAQALLYPLVRRGWVGQA